MQNVLQHVQMENFTQKQTCLEEDRTFLSWLEGFNYSCLFRSHDDASRLLLLFFLFLFQLFPWNAAFADQSPPSQPVIGIPFSHTNYLRVSLTTYNPPLNIHSIYVVHIFISFKPDQWITFVWNFSLDSFCVQIVLRFLK